MIQLTFENILCLILAIFGWFLNQARAGRRLAHAWFLEIAFVHDVGMRVCVCVSVCLSAPEAINNYSREMKP